jgi:hypothetical protein
VRVCFGRCAIVLFLRAALTALLMFRFAAARCLLVVISLGEHSREQARELFASVTRFARDVAGREIFDKAAQHLSPG